MADLLDKLEQLEKAATPGPWKWVEKNSIDFGYVGPNGERTVLFGEDHEGAVHQDDPDGKFLAALRNALPELLRRLRAAEADAERWKYLESLQCNQFILSKNEDNASNYTTAKEWIEEFCPDDFTDTPEEEIQRMKETNTIWRLQIYPDTPIGFCVFFGATLQAAIDAERGEAVNGFTLIAIACISVCSCTAFTVYHRIEADKATDPTTECVRRAIWHEDRLSCLRVTKDAEARKP